ncbi:WhiB family transcriptional regulator [Streptomyces sp. NPDC087568]|uniref:WhiB family transcriptional regulator n=1 Tax=Streptomyces sp. NPDC087568 TaxID=3365799 RepID=UPI0037FF3C70
MNTLPELTAGTPSLPCRLDPEPFFSDEPLERHYAARQCGACPLLLRCRLYALATRQPWGVWGAIDMAAAKTLPTAS